MTDELYPALTPDLARMRQVLSPEAAAAFNQFGKVVFSEGALAIKIKHIIAVAAAHVTQCPYCIRGHTRAALHAGATDEELMEAIWVAAEMRAGAAFAHSIIAIAEMGETGVGPNHRQHTSATGERHGDTI
jgi:AhpD family alkylhydroperoxidase